MVSFTAHLQVQAEGFGGRREKTVKDIAENQERISGFYCFHVYVDNVLTPLTPFPNTAFALENLFTPAPNLMREEH